MGSLTRTRWINWWPPADEAAADEARRLEYIVEEYKKGDVYPASTDHL